MRNEESIYSMRRYSAKPSPLCEPQPVKETDNSKREDTNPMVLAFITMPEKSLYFK